MPPTTFVFFLLSKILDVCVSPLCWALLLALAGAVLLWRRPALRRVRIACFVAAPVLLYAFSTHTVSHLLARAVERTARSSERPDSTYDVAVVLGGAVDLEMAAATGRVEFGEAVDRVLAGFRLLHERRARCLLLSGGNPLGAHGVIESKAIADELQRWGVTADQIVIEPASRNTHENAVESARIIHEHGWTSVLLITSAAHMERAAGCFRAAGVRFDTLAVDYRASSPTLPLDPLPRAEWLAQSEWALRECVGRLVYRALGYSTPYSASV